MVNGDDKKDEDEEKDGDDENDDDDNEDGRMASAARPICSWPSVCRGSSGMIGLMSGLTSKSTDSMDETSTFTPGVRSGARGRRCSLSLLSLGGRREDDGRGGAEQ